MHLTDFVRGVPDDVWAVFEPILPPVVWKGNGRKPKENRECLHALLYILIAGIGWELLPAGFPSYKTVRRPEDVRKAGRDRPARRCRRRSRGGSWPPGARSR